MVTACVSQRCGLCCFKLNENDKIFASKLISRYPSDKAQANWYNLQVTEDGQQSGEMINNLSMDDSGGSLFEECIESCSHRHGRAIGCHAMCGNSVPASFLRASFLKVLVYQYEPLPAETTQRMRLLYLRWASTSVLRYAKPALPAELCLQVGRYLLQGPFLHRYAVASTYASVKKIEYGNSHICVSAEIWASFAEFEGVRYISSLSNTPDEHHTRLLFTPSPSQTVDTIYTAENYLGVMQALFCSSVQAPTLETRRGLWWRVARCCSRESREARLIAQTDVSCLISRTCEEANRSQGVKLRRVIPEYRDGSGAYRPLWSIPPSRTVRWVQLEPSPPAAQIIMLNFDSPGTTGLSVCWMGRIKHMHVNTPRDDFAFYQGYNEGI